MLDLLFPFPASGQEVTTDRSIHEPQTGIQAWVLRLGCSVVTIGLVAPMKAHFRLSSSVFLKGVKFAVEPWAPVCMN